MNNRFQNFSIDNINTDLKYCGLLEQVKHFNDKEKEIFQHCVWYNKHKNIGLVITRKYFCDNKDNYHYDSSIENIVKEITENVSLNTIFNEYAKKYIEIYDIEEADTFESVLNTKNSLVSIN